METKQGISPEGQRVTFLAGDCDCPFSGKEMATMHKIGCHNFKKESDNHDCRLEKGFCNCANIIEAE